MHVISPDRYQKPPIKRTKKPAIFIVIFLLLGLGAYNYFRPLPTPKVVVTTVIPGSLAYPQITWPSAGQAAAAADGYGLLGTNSTQTPLATASITKVIAALCVLQKQPLNLNDQGTTYTIGASDVAIYNNYVAQGGSVTDVVQGEQLTEYQALEALMLPSANNVADSLVTWVFGSLPAYKTYATNFLQQHNMNQTTIGSDASGFDPSTTSTASDLTTLGLLALKNPVLMQITGKESATLPVAGTVTNYDTALGTNGITGLKTGNNDQDKGAFLFSAQSQVGSQSVDLTGAVMGEPDLATALQDSTQLVASLQKDFEQTTITTQGQKIGTITTAWGQSASLITTQNVQLVRWKATPISAIHNINPNVRSGTVGSLKVSAGKAQASSNIRLQHTIANPSFWWRLTRH